MHKGKLRSQKGAGQKTAKAEFESNATQSGQDLSSKFGGKRLHILGIIMKTAGLKRPSEIVRSLDNIGIVGIMEAANIYRSIRTMEKDGLITKDKSGYTLTELGEQVCPDKTQLDRLFEATRIILEIKESIRKRFYGI